MDKDLQIERDIDKKEKGNFIQEFIKEIKEKLENSKQLKDMKIDDGTVFVVDRFEEDLAVCENRTTGEMVNLKTSELPENLKESDVLVYKNNCYKIDNDKRQEIKERINEKMKNIFED